MEHLRERFLKTYSNIPLNLRDEIILVLEGEPVNRPITWDVAYIEVKANTNSGQKILRELAELGLI